MTKSRKKVRNRKNHRKSSKVQISKIVLGVFWKYFQIFLDLPDPLKEAKNHQNLIELEITIFLTVVLKFFFKLLLEIIQNLS